MTQSTGVSERVSLDDQIAALRRYIEVAEYYGGAGDDTIAARDIMEMRAALATLERYERLMMAVREALT